MCHIKENKGKRTVGWYSKNIALQQDNAVPGGRMYNSYLDSFPSARSEDLVYK